METDSYDDFQKKIALFLSNGRVTDVMGRNMPYKSNIYRQG
jgi:hypothetical protein